MVKGTMKKFLKNLNLYVEKTKSIREIILTNIVLIGQTPYSRKTKSDFDYLERTEIFLERLSDANADECTMDSYGNPYAIIKGKSKTKPPIMLVAHMDTLFESDHEFHYSITNEQIIGPGLLDNSLGVGVLMSIPDILKVLKIQFQSDLILVGLPESLRENNLKSIREVLSFWKHPLRGAVCIEGGIKGRLNYYSKGMVQAEVECRVPVALGWDRRHGVNAIVIANEIINNMLKIRLPQRPKTEIIIGKFRGGVQHGDIPLFAKLGFEIHSDSDKMVEETYYKIEEICTELSMEYGAKIDLIKINNVKAASLTYHHPLVKSAIQVMDALGIKPMIESSESELSVFLHNKIPAITIGIANGENYHQEDERINIDSMYRGIAQLIGIITAIDRGVCDE